MLARPAMHILAFLLAGLSCEVSCTSKPAHAADPAPVPRSAGVKIKSEAIPPGGYADFTIEVPKGASVIWRISPVPVQQSKGLPAGRLAFGGLQGKTYVATAIVVDFDAKTVTDADYVFVFGGVALPPVKPPVPPVDPPIPTPTALYFLIVRADGPASAAFTKTMGDPAWATLRAAGHLVKDKTATEAVAIGFTVGAALPVVVTLREDATKSVIVRSAIPLPTTSAAILDLPKGVK